MLYLEKPRVAHRFFWDNRLREGLKSEIGAGVEKMDQNLEWTVDLLK